MSLSLITFSEYSESSNDQIPQLLNSIPEKNQSLNLNQCHHPPRFPLVRSVVRKIDIRSEESNVTNNFPKVNFPTKSHQTNQNTNEKKFSYKNGRKILISKKNIMPENPSFKKSIKINPRLIQFSLDSNNESESYYDYSYSQYYSETTQNDENPNISNENTNSNNLPSINSLNNQTIKEESDKSNINMNNFNNISINSNQLLPIKDISLDKYIVERKKNGISIMGKSMKYTLSRIEGSKFLPSIEAVVTGSKVSIINTTTRKIVGSIKTKKNHSHFLIRKNFLSCYDKVIMEITYTSYNNTKPRSSFIKIYEPIFPDNNDTSNANNNTNDTSNNTHIENETRINPSKLHSRRPKRGTFGMWSLDFGSRRIISSIKNSIIVDDEDKEYFIIGKVSENSLSVDVAKGVDPIYILGIAVSAYMNTKP